MASANNDMVTRKRGRCTVNWEKEVGSVMKQKNLTNDDAINWQLWQKARQNH